MDLEKQQLKETISDGVYIGESVYNSLGKCVTIKTINNECCIGEFMFDGNSIKKFLEGNKIEAWLVGIGDNWDYQSISKYNTYRYIFANCNITVNMIKFP